MMDKGWALSYTLTYIGGKNGWTDKLNKEGIDI